jgi:hypothetical protein
MATTGMVSLLPVSTWVQRCQPVVVGEMGQT